MNTSNPKWDFTLIIDRTFFLSLCEERESPIDEIGLVFSGKTKRTRDYVFQGMKVAGIGTMGFFIIIELGELLIGGNGPNGQSPNTFANLFDWPLILSIFTVPAGALIGYIRGQAAQGNAVEYVIGDGEWVLLK